MRRLSRTRASTWLVGGMALVLAGCGDLESAPQAATGSPIVLKPLKPVRQARRKPIPVPPRLPEPAVIVCHPIRAATPLSPVDKEHLFRRFAAEQANPGTAMADSATEVSAAVPDAAPPCP